MTKKIYISHIKRKLCKEMNMILHSGEKEKEKQKTEEPTLHNPGRVLSPTKEVSHEVNQGINPSFACLSAS